MTLKKNKAEGDPFEKGDPVWVMNLGGKNRAGFYDYQGAVGQIYVTIGKTKSAGWWVDKEKLRHRSQDDGVEGDSASKALTDGPDFDLLDPLGR